MWLIACEDHFKRKCAQQSFGYKKCHCFFYIGVKRKRKMDENNYWFYYGRIPPHALSISPAKWPTRQRLMPRPYLNSKGLRVSQFTTRRLSTTAILSYFTRVGSWGLDSFGPSNLASCAHALPAVSSASARPSSSSVHDHRRSISSAQNFDINLQRSYVSTSIAAISKLENFGS